MAYWERKRTHNLNRHKVTSGPSRCLYLRKANKGLGAHLLWWRLNSHCFSHLAALTRKHLAVPAYSTPSEKALSTSGLVMGKLRASLTPDTVDNLVFRHQNANQRGVDPAMRLVSSTATNIAVKVEQPSPVVSD